MDSVQHSATGFALGHASNLPADQCFIAAVVSLLPDAIGWAEKIYKDKPNAWVWYNMVHGGWFAVGISIFGIVATLISGSDLGIVCALGWLIHVALDTQTHSLSDVPIGRGNRWWIKSERLYTWEVPAWILLVCYFLFAYVIV